MCFGNNFVCTLDLNDRDESRKEEGKKKVYVSTVWLFLFYTLLSSDGKPISSTYLSFDCALV